MLFPKQSESIDPSSLLNSWMVSNHYYCKHVSTDSFLKNVHYLRSNDPNARLDRAYGRYDVVYLATIYGYIISDIIVDQSSSLQKGILIGLIIGESFLIIGAILGIIGSKKRKPCLLFIFTIVVLLFTAVFIGLGIASDYVPNAIFEKEDC